MIRKRPHQDDYLNHDTMPPRLRFLAGLEPVERINLDVKGPVRVSTIRLISEHGREASGRMLPYETMVFGGDLDGEMHRYATLDEAVAGHRQTCARVFQQSPEGA